jgi:hypothetical protein
MPARPSPTTKKEGAPPPRAPRRGSRDDSDPGDAGVLDPDASGPMLAASGGDEDDATRGEWLFKHNDMVLGPVTAIVLVERIKQGELSADTPIARDGQPFKPMKLVPLFREAYEATLERKRREKEEREYNAAVTRSRVLRVFVFLFVILAPAGAGAVAGRVVMIMQPWDKTADWIARAPPLVDLPPRPVEVVKAPPPPPANAADRDDDDRDRAERSDRGDRVDARDKRVARLDKKKADKGTDKADKAGDKDEDKGASTAGADKAFVKELTNEQAVAPLKDPAVKGPLGACFKAELDSNPDMPSQLNLSYTITEAGRSANVQLTNRELRGRPVQECVRQALSNARWPRFEGERKNVTVPFNIKKPVKPAEGPVTGTKR